MNIVNLKQNGVIINQNKSGNLNAFDVDINNGCRFIKSGLKTQAQFDLENYGALKCGAPRVIKGESRVVIDREEREVIVQFNDLPNYENETILERKIIDVAGVDTIGIEGQEGYIAGSPEVSHQEYYYIVPETSHTEWYCEANYTIEVEDTESEAYKLAHYAELRTGPEGYASIGEQLDMQYKDLLNGTTTWKDHIESIKNKFPKI